MAFTSGQWGPDTFIDNAGNTVLIGATVTASGYVCTVDSLGNLTVTGPADDSVTLTVTPATGAAYTQVVPVRPLVSELETVQGLAVAAETPAGAQAKADAAEAAAEATAAAALAASEQSATATYQPKVKVADLTYPLVIPHRGAGTNIAPESTKTSRALAMSLGFEAIEGGDWHYLPADGALANMHDATVDRTTTSTGNVSALSAMAFRNLIIDSSATLSPLWADEQPELFEEVLADAGGKVVMFHDTKTTSAIAPMVERIVARGLQESSVIASWDTAALQTAVAAGIACAYTMTTGTEKTPAEVATLLGVASIGIGFVIVPTTAAAMTSTLIGQFAAVGVKVIGYTPARQYDVDAWLAKGAHGFYSDDPVYAQGSLTSYAYKRTSVPMVATYDHGMIDNASSRAKWVNTAPVGVGWTDTTSAGGRSMLIGSLGPISDTTYSIEVDYLWTSAAGSSNWVGFFACCPNDLSIGGSAVTGAHGYRGLISPLGLAQLARFTNGAAAATLLSTDYADLTLPKTVTLRLDVTPTHLTFTADGNVLTSVADSTYRGGYFHIAMSGCTARATRIAKVA